MNPPVRSPSTKRKRDDSGSDARERTLSTAYRLFSQHGVQAVGVDRIIAEAGIAKATLYKHFGSKQELVLAALQRREDVWSRGWLEQEIMRRAGTPTTRLLAIFDLFDEWFRRDDYESCLFIKALLEEDDRTSPIAQASVAHLTNVHTLIRDLAEEAGIADPDVFANRWQLLMMGAITAASAGDVDAALRARELATLLLRSAER